MMAKISIGEVEILGIDGNLHRVSPGFPLLVPVYGEFFWHAERFVITPMIGPDRQPRSGMFHGTHFRTGYRVGIAGHSLKEAKEFALQRLNWLGWRKFLHVARGRKILNFPR